ncbi:hypothetical protein BDW62DRAFT_200092 [Aspergillus aurantiobrunneus]
MNLTFALTSMLFAALSSTVVGKKEDAPVVGSVTLITPIGPESYPARTFCTSRPAGPTKLDAIVVTPTIPDDHIQCTVYSSIDCDGDQLTFSTGKHQFSRPFVAASWKCEDF